MALFFFVLFALGYVFGLLLKNPTAGKFLIFGFVGIFVYEPVKEAGLLASAVFLVGIISHHITPSSILESLPRFSLPRPARPQRPSRSRRPQGQRKSEETTEQTHERYEEYVKRNRGGEKKAEAKEEDLHHRRGYTSRNPEYQREDRDEKNRGSKPQAETSAAQDELRRAREQLKREQERLEAERREFAKQQQDRRTPPDDRTDEQVLGVSGEYSLAELKRARNAEVKRWNTSNMRHKPAHLIEHSEEEAKKINLAYENLSKLFK